MIKIKNILLSLALFFSISFADVLAPDISFLDLPLSGKSASLGNTFLADVGSPTNLLLNPSNIWFGNDVNSSPKIFMKNIFHRVSLSNFNMMGSDSHMNLMYSLQYGDKLTMGLGYVENTRYNIDQYDDNANYIGEIQYQEKAVVVGMATEWGGVNIGASVGLVNNNFYGDNINHQDDLYLSTIGLSMNNKYIKIKRNDFNRSITQYLVYPIPDRISMHLSSRNIFYDEFSDNSLYKNIIGIKLDYLFSRDGDNQMKKNLIYFILDYSSNNNVTDNVFNFGLGYERFFKNNIGSLNFNMGLKRIESFDGFSYGIEYKDKTTDLSISLANVTTAWNEDYIVISFKYSYDK